MWQGTKKAEDKAIVFPWESLEDVGRLWDLSLFYSTAFNVLFQKGERCQCNPGFLGHSCQLGLHDDSGAGQWWRVSEGNPQTPSRTGSAGVYLSSTGAMYLFGGEYKTQEYQ